MSMYSVVCTQYALLTCCLSNPPVITVDACFLSLSFSVFSRDEQFEILPYITQVDTTNATQQVLVELQQQCKLNLMQGREHYGDHNH